MKSKMAKVYIAGPITGVPDYRLKFAAAAAEFRRKDDIVFNPATMPAGLPFEAYMPICYAMMDACDTVFFLAGWQRSRGANLEMEYATAKNMKIRFQEG